MSSDLGELRYRALTPDLYWSKYLKRDPCFLSESSSPFDEEHDEYARGLCTQLEGARVLEIGCGDGADAIGLVEKYGCKQVIAIDISGARLQVARKNVRRAGISDRISLLRMDAHQGAFPERYFDVVFCNSVVLFLDRERFFPEVVRMVKPGGRLLLMREALAGNPILALYRALWPARWKRFAQSFSNHLTVKEIEGASRRYFASVEHREFYLFFSILRRSFPWFIHRVIRGRVQYRFPACQWSRAVDRMLLRKFPFLRRFAWITVACFRTPTSADAYPMRVKKSLMTEIRKMGATLVEYAYDALVVVIISLLITRILAK